MTDTDDTDIDATVEEENGTEKKKKGGKTEGDAQGVRAVSVSEGFYSYMTGIGASPSLIASILKSWSHLRGQGLLRAISDFVRGASTRATAHVQVDINENKGFTLLHSLIQVFKTYSSRAPTNTHTLNKHNTFDPK